MACFIAALLVLDCSSSASSFPGKQLFESALWNSGKSQEGLKEAYFLQTRKGQGKDLYPKGPIRSCLVSKLLERVSRPKFTS